MCNFIAPSQQEAPKDVLDGPIIVEAVPNETKLKGGACTTACSVAIVLLAFTSIASWKPLGFRKLAMKADNTTETCCILVPQRMLRPDVLVCSNAKQAIS